MTIRITPTIATLNTRMKFCQAGTSPAFTSADIEDALAEAVLSYQEYRPKTNATNLDLVVGQAEYSWPVDAVDILPMVYILSPDTAQSPIYTYWGSQRLLEEMLDELNSPAVKQRYDAFRVRLREAQEGSMQVDAVRRKIVLTPPPTEAMTVAISYIVNYALTGVDPDRQYADIPDVDYPAIVSMAQAVLMRRLARGYAVNDQTLGDRKIPGRLIAENLDKDAERLEQDFRDRYYRPVIERT